jgi:hypothetical protein
VLAASAFWRDRDTARSTMFSRASIVVAADMCPFQSVFASEFLA